MKVRIQKLYPEARLPRYHTAQSAAFDLETTEDISVMPKEIKLVKTGLIIQTPPGYFLLIAARSSTPRKKGLVIAQGIGIIDADYCGPEDEIFIQIYNFTDQIIKVNKGERLAQALFLKSEQVEWDEVSQINEKSRGGFGSTGD